jgi:hypothetical protein
MYLLQIQDEYPFLGVLNSLLEREGFCLNTYENGDIYFGYFSDNERNRHGIYSYKPKLQNEFLLSEHYYGLWKDDQKDDHGIYLWLKENKNIKPFSDFENSSFNAFVGNFEFEKFLNGALLIKKGNEYYVYYGNFNKEGKKEGDLCFFYSAQKELLLYGTFENDVFTSGYMATFNDDGILLKICKYKKGQIINKDQINSLEIEIVEKILFNFRNVIMSKDYFGMIYDEFGKIINYRNNKMNDLDILNSDEYINIMNTIIGYNKITIFNDIEKYVVNKNI